MESDLKFHGIVSKSLFLTTVLITTLFCCSKLSAQDMASAGTKTIAEVFQYIEEESNYHVFYQNNQIDLTKVVTVNTQQNNIDKILDLVLQESGLTYKYVDDQIVIIPLNKTIEDDKITIKGKVFDESGLPLPGVNIIIEGTNNGTITNLDGEYIIEVDNLNIKLVFSFMGFKSQVIPLDGRTEINVILYEDYVALEEIVAIGYGTKKKADVTGSVSVVSSSEIADLPVATIDQALQGKATGVKVTQSTGAPGEGIAIRVRGIGTINDNTPLYIIDGIPTKTGFSALSPGDIESISILKDASASIYGARAANGVIIVTTKSGKKSETALVTYSMNTGLQQAYNLTKMCNKDQYIELYNEAAAADGRSITITQEMADTLPNTNWWDEIFRPALMTNHHLTVSGGTDKSNYIISGNYFKQDGIVLNSAFDRYSVKSSVNSKLTDKLTTGININLSRTSMDIIGSSGDGLGGNGGSVVRYAFFRTPIYPVKDRNG
jgi:TonB-linked SusC/RagA family outer membrane protein